MFRIQQNDAAVQYAGTWYPNTLAGHSGGSAVLAMNAGAQARVTFTGTGVRWIGYRDQWSGIASVYLDGVYQGPVDTYSTAGQFQAVLFTATGLSGGTHTLAVQATGTRRSASGGAWVWVDAFDIAGRVEQNGPAVTYSGNWYPNSLSAHSGGSATLAMDAGSRATFTFNGVGARWIAYRDQWSGIANVYVDGTFVGQVDTYSNPAGAQRVAFTKTGLPYGTHTLSVQVTGTRDSASGGAWVWVDAFDALP